MPPINISAQFQRCHWYCLVGLPQRGSEAPSANAMKHTVLHSTVRVIDSRKHFVNGISINGVIAHQKSAYMCSTTLLSQVVGNTVLVQNGDRPRCAQISKQLPVQSLDRLGLLHARTPHHANTMFSVVEIVRHQTGDKRRGTQVRC